jgi:hypothetical protein
MTRRAGEGSMKQSTELKDLMLRIYEALAKGDQAFFERYVSQEDSTLAVGTDPNEWWGSGATFTKVLGAQLQETGGFELVADAPRAYSEGVVGWVADRPKLKLPGAEILYA